MPTQRIVGIFESQLEGHPAAMKAKIHLTSSKGKTSILRGFVFCGFIFGRVERVK